MAEDERLRRWQEHDLRWAVDATDRRATEHVAAAKALVLELLGSGAAATRDLYSACARLGGLIADAGGSPTLAGATMDGLGEALDGAWPAATPASALRASVLEGYVAARIERETRRAQKAWEFPACAVPIDARTVALTAGRPGSDDLAEWAGRVALAVSRAKFRRALVSGTAPATAELTHALTSIGIAVGPEPAATPWFRRVFRT